MGSGRLIIIHTSHTTASRQPEVVGRRALYPTQASTSFCQLYPHSRSPHTPLIPMMIDRCTFTYRHCEYPFSSDEVCHWTSHLLHVLHIHVHVHVLHIHVQYMYVHVHVHVYMIQCSNGHSTFIYMEIQYTSIALIRNVYTYTWNITFLCIYKCTYMYLSR